jgi:hypothetical protein
MYRIFHPAAAQYMFLSVAHGIFSKIDHTFRHKPNFNKYKKTEITPHILLDHNGVKLEINSKKFHRKYPNTWRLNSTLLNGQCIIEGLK